MKNEKGKNLFVGLALAAMLAVPSFGYADNGTSRNQNFSQPAATQQQTNVSGIVRDNTGEPLIGVSVTVKNNPRTGAVTDMDGRYSISVPRGTTLVFSYVGYKSQEVKANGSQVNITLQEDRSSLDEVVVVGYGTMKKRDLTGSITTVKNDAITASLTSNALEALQGKSTGVAVFSNNQVGAEPKIRIRGTASINAEVDPLIVVDGFPLVDGNMNDINPADIESMEVLKDASSTAIYGSRGANGVIMITTKKGAAGRNNLSAHATLGVSSPSRLIDLIDGQDFVNFITEAYQNAGMTPPSLSTKYNTNWQKEILESTALTQDYGVTFDGANDRTNYMLSGGYYNQDALIPGRGFEKFSIHTNLDHKFNSWLTVGASMQVTVSNHNILTDQVLNDIFRFGWPTDPVYNEDGSYNILSHGEFWNPLADNSATTNRTKSNRFLGNFYASAQISKHLNYKISIGYDTKTANNYRFSTSQTAKSIAQGLTTSSGRHNWSRSRSKLMDNILTYSNQWDDHRFTATAVYSWQDYSYNYSQMAGQFDNDLLGAWNFAGANQASLTTESDAYSNRLISYTGRATYAYQDKYMVTATIRFDGSSRFGEDSKWGTFPSFGLAWRVTEEEFLKDHPVITDLKIRGSYGVTGNQEIGNYQSLARLSTDNNGNYADGKATLTGYYESVGNSKLKWERTTQIDLGFDLSLFNRIFLNVDYYNRDTNDLLYSVPIPSTSGYSSVLSNIGKVNNRGLEVALNADIVRNKDLKVNFGVNFSTNTNELKELYGDVDEVTVNNGFGTTGLSRILRVGESVTGVYGLKSLGIIKTQQELDAYKAEVPEWAANYRIGDEMYANLDGDKTISASDLICIGSVEPKFFYGLNLGVEYKKFSLQVYGQGAWKYAAMAGAENSGNNGTHWTLGYQDIGSYALWADNSMRNLIGVPSKDAYKKMGDTYPAAGARNMKLSDRTNADWSFFVLRNIQLGYDFTDLLKLTEIKTVKSLVLNVNFQNFVAFANHTGYNPENGDVSNPFARTIMFGISAKF
ncbi:MAG: TonB-dependent receptor [Prevotella sp.]|nr:TonB-dependent receptor [Prevotella sp.]